MGKQLSCRHFPTQRLQAEINFLFQTSRSHFFVSPAYFIAHISPHETMHPIIFFSFKYTTRKTLFFPELTQQRRSRSKTDFRKQNARAKKGTCFGWVENEARRRRRRNSFFSFSLLFSFLRWERRRTRGRRSSLSLTPSATEDRARAGGFVAAHSTLRLSQESSSDLRVNW